MILNAGKAIQTDEGVIFPLPKFITDSRQVNFIIDMLAFRKLITIKPVDVVRDNAGYWGMRFPDPDKDLLDSIEHIEDVINGGLFAGWYLKNPKEFMEIMGDEDEI